MSYFPCRQCRGFVTLCPGAEGSPICGVGQRLVSQGCRETGPGAAGGPPNCCEAFRCTCKTGFYIMQIDSNNLKTSARSKSASFRSIYLLNTQLPAIENIEVGFSLESIAYLGSIKFLSVPMS
jgi:hypothetical protein